MLSIDNLVIKSEEQNLLEVHSLKMQAGETLLLIGDNNSGKSLLLQAIHGAYDAYEGDIMLKEKPALFYKKRKKTILIDYPFRLLLNQSVFANITLPLGKIKPALQETISDLCKIAELGEIYNTPMTNYSRSDKKLVEIIRAIIQKINVILIDDIDQYFDEKKFLKVKELIQFGNAEKSSFLLTAKKNVPQIENVYRIQNKKVVKL